VIADLAWMSGAWTGTKRTISKIGKRWSPTRGGAAQRRRCASVSKPPSRQSTALGAGTFVK
jgi:hypothetical protein